MSTERDLTMDDVPVIGECRPLRRLPELARAEAILSVYSFDVTAYVDEFAKRLSDDRLSVAQMALTYGHCLICLANTVQGLANERLPGAPPEQADAETAVIANEALELALAATQTPVQAMRVLGYAGNMLALCTEALTAARRAEE